MYRWFILICILTLWFILLNNLSLIDFWTKYDWDNSIDNKVRLVIYAESWTTIEDVLNSIEPLNLNVYKINITTGYKIERFNIPDDAIWFEIKLNDYIQPLTFHNNDEEQLKENKAFYYVGFWHVIPSSQL